MQVINTEPNRTKNWFEQEIEKYLSQLEKEPDNTDLLIKIGRLYRANFVHKNSEKYFKAALKKNPDNYEAYYNLGNKGYNKFYFPHIHKAITLAKQQNDQDFVDNVSKDITDYYADLGWEYSESNNHEKVKRYFQKAITWYPRHIDAHNGLANYYSEHKRDYSKAKTFYQKALEFSEPMINELQQESEAIDEQLYFWGQLETRPYMRALCGLGMCDFRLGDRNIEKKLLQNSLQTFQKMLQLNPNDNQGIRFILPDVYHKMGEYSQAIQGYLDVLEQDRGNTNCIAVAYNAGLAYYKTHDSSHAEEWFRRGIRNNPFIAIFLLYSAREVDNWKEEITTIYEGFDTQDFWRKYSFEYNAACYAVDWSWNNLWLEVQDIRKFQDIVKNRIQFFKKIYLEEKQRGLHG
jgi:tetratricopeptide (TPR) repeat protein